ncbi:helix-turn-helix transcriptional regulator [Halosimplex rubrum]|uniref:helix-turn-helix transcriptional regulator n=1 Tax=Halosimplex rubrum TaxID=869889 RepID=UPI001C54F932|nr:hypothetical protein [Halosimplex rubrum]
MAVQPTGVLTPDELNDTDGRVLDVLHDGRVTPQYVAGELDVSRTYASERLKRLVEHNHVRKLASGLYELADDPREEDSAAADESDLRARLQDALEARDDAQARADRLADRVADLEAQLDDARGGQDTDTGTVAEAADALARGLNRLPDDAPGRTSLEDARALLEGAVGDD